MLMSNIVKKFSIAPALVLGALILTATNTVWAEDSDSVKNEKMARRDLDRIRATGTTTHITDLQSVSNLVSGYLRLEDDLRTEILALQKQLISLGRSIENFPSRAAEIRNQVDLTREEHKNANLNASELRYLSTLLEEIKTLYTSDVDNHREYAAIYDQIVIHRAELKLIDGKLRYELIPTKMDLDRDFYKDLVASRKYRAPKKPVGANDEEKAAYKSEVATGNREAFAAQSILRFLPGASQAVKRNEATYLPFALEGAYWQKLTEDASNEELLAITREIHTIANLYDSVESLSEDASKLEMVRLAKEFNGSYLRYQKYEKEKEVIQNSYRKLLGSIRVEVTSPASLAQFKDPEISRYLLEQSPERATLLLDERMDTERQQIQQIMRRAYVQAFKTESGDLKFKTLAETAAIIANFAMYAGSIGLALIPNIHDVSVWGTVPLVAAMSSVLTTVSFMAIRDWREDKHKEEVPSRVINHFFGTLSKFKLPINEIMSKSSFACQFETAVD